MLRSPILFLIFISWMSFLPSCSSPYRELYKTGGNIRCIQQFRPVFTTIYYNAEVKAVGREFNGILIMKRMADSTIRMVFSTTPGIKIFDFEFLADSEFRVLYIMKEFNKEAIIKTLRKDFELLLFLYTYDGDGYILTNGTRNFYTFPRENGFYYYITDSNCRELLLMQRASSRKAIVDISMKYLSPGGPDSINIQHRNVNFTIGLRKMNVNVNR
jgi:hypothetical protein